MLLRKLLAGTALFIAIVFAFLEIGSRYYKCPVTDWHHQDVLVCDTNYYPVNQNRIYAVQSIIKQKQQNMEPSREDIDQAVNLTKYEDMPGLNGIVCEDGMIFVRDNLSSEGKYFVARHELEHVFIGNGLNKDCVKEEYCATMSAVKNYPLGFVETVLSSLYISSQEAPTVWCFIFSSWNIFRVYVLGW
ncbi:MAG: hypothetical protein HY865_18300 [Chloroflexi bacterium]|nr:hypothetical protein [Chloroflexota bacterium]